VEYRHKEGEDDEVVIYFAW